MHVGSWRLDNLNPYVLSCWPEELNPCVVSCRPGELNPHVVSCYLGELGFHVVSCRLGELDPHAVSCRQEELNPYVVSCRLEELNPCVVSWRLAELNYIWCDPTLVLWKSRFLTSKPSIQLVHHLAFNTIIIIPKYPNFIMQKCLFNSKFERCKGVLIASTQNRRAQHYDATSS